MVFLIVDAHSGLITDVNPFMLHLLGTSREQIVNQALWQIGLLSDQLAQQAFLAQLQQDRQLSHDLAKLAAKDGRLRSIEWVSTLFQANGHEIIQCNIAILPTADKQKKTSFTWLPLSPRAMTLF